mgnify:CR=1 FL=1
MVVDFRYIYRDIYFVYTMIYKLYFLFFYQIFSPISNVEFTIRDF